MRRVVGAPWWLYAFVVPAALLAPVLVAGAMRIAWPYLPTSTFAPDPMLVRYGPAAVCALIFASVLAPPRPVPRIVRAVVLSSIIAAALLAWGCWLWRHVRTDLAKSGPYLYESLPVTDVALTVLAIACAGALWVWLRPRKGPPDWLRTGVVLLLLHVLVLGVSLPLFVHYWPDGLLDEGRHFVRFVLAVPTMVVAMFHGVVWRQPARKRRWDVIVAVLYTGGVAAASTAVALTPRRGLEAYGYFGLILAAEAAVALIGTALFASTQWLASRPLGDARRAATTFRDGTVVADRSRVAWIRNVGWLHGLRAETTAFRLRTDEGLLDVPANYRLALPIPVWTISMRAGARVPVLRAGDRVRVSGWVEPTADGPYRRSAAPVPGRAGLSVSPVDRGDARPGQDALLAVWRPCLLCLAALTAAAAPAAIAMFREQLP